MPSQIVHGWEHCSLEQGKNNSADLDKIKKHLSEIPSKDNDPKTLGLHKVGNEIRPGNYIGAVWIGKGDSRVVLRVDSKFEKMDYVAMFVECCEDSDVGKRMHGCLNIWHEQELIEILNADDFSFMVAVAFLRELNTLCTRHLRRHFHRQRENFVGKVKGKILIGENLRRNIGHAERMFCEYQAISDDILENRILRAALEKTARYLSANQMLAKKYPSLQLWVHSCRAHLHSVSVVHIAQRDFRAIRHRGAFAPYRRPLDLAKSVLYHFGFNPHAEREKYTKTPPYSIDSAELFERYVEVQLSKKCKNIVVPKNIRNPKDGFQVRVRPDFYVQRQGGKKPRIIDAKYKDMGKVMKNNRMRANDDLYQVIAYSQHFGVLNELNEHTNDMENTDNIKLWLAYPWLKGMQSWPKKRFTKAFTVPIYIHKIECPTRSETESE